MHSCSAFLRVVLKNHYVSNLGKTCTVSIMPANPNSTSTTTPEVKVVGPITAISNDGNRIEKVEN